MPDRTIAVVSAGIGQPSATRLLADRLAAATERQMSDRGDRVRFEVIEARDHAQDLTNNLLTGFPSPKLRQAIESIVRADGLIAVTPVFSASYSGLFKTMFDVLERDALAGRPVLMGATAGTARHSLVLEHAMRPLFAYLGALVVPTGVFAAAEDWGDRGDDADGGALVDRIERAARELATAVGAGAPSPARDPFDDPVPFARLLAGDDD